MALLVVLLVLGSRFAEAVVLQYNEPPDLHGVLVPPPPLGHLDAGLNTVSGTIYQDFSTNTDYYDPASVWLPAGYAITSVTFTVYEFTILSPDSCCAAGEIYLTDGSQVLHQSTFTTVLNASATNIMEALPHTIDVLGPSTPIHGPETGSRTVYLGTITRSSVHRLHYTYEWRIMVEGDNGSPPSASFTFSPTTPRAGDTITLDASGSTGNIVRYDWVVEDPWNTYQGKVVTLDAGGEGRYTIALTVTDSAGRTSSVAKVVYVSGLLPNGLDTSILKKGDLLFRRSTEEVQYILDLGSLYQLHYGYWRHVGFYLGDGLVIDAEAEDGVEIRDIGPNYGNVPVWAVGRVFSESQAEIALQYAIDHIGTEYGKENLFHSLLNQQADFRWAKGWGLYCSQLVWLAGMEVGIDLDSDKIAFFKAVLPDEVFLDNDVTIIDQNPGNQRRTNIRAECPVDLLLIDPFGRKTGIDPVTGTILEDIPDVLFSGQGEEYMPEHFSIEDLDGAWTLEVRGTGNGLFTIVTENIQKNNFLTERVTRTAFPGSLTTYLVKNPKEGVSLTLTLLIDIDIQPETLNLQSKGLFTAFIELPAGYGEDDVDFTAVECEGTPAVKAMMADDGVLIVKFDREALAGVSSGDAVVLAVTGKFTDETLFGGSDTVRVIGKGGKKK